jgi:hypothetical protein
MTYEVHLYSIPKVSEDGKQALPGPESKRQEFTSVDDARRFAFENKDRFDRVVLMENRDDGQKLVERYVDAIQA